jgi:hypothetical protein
VPRRARVDLVENLDLRGGGTGRGDGGGVGAVQGSDGGPTTVPQGSRLEFGAVGVGGREGPSVRSSGV